ncbi:cysteine desulfurase [Candidatus Saccharibacteria bacterium]|nr:cysteine desulfurase [Candidatus Saccharibacteria bacterium]
MIYLDYAAATPVSEKALRAMEPFFTEDFFNPSAAYYPAKLVREKYETAKNEIAHLIGAKGTDLVMTSGATESNELAFSSLLTPVNQKVQARNQTPQNLPEVLVLETEHAAVLENAKRFSNALVKVDKNDLIILDDLKKKLSPATRLISVSLANNELGTIQPLAEIAELVRSERMNRLRRGNLTPLYLHSDASQALNLIDISVARLGVDLLTLNSAKVYGPKGVGALYVAHGVKLSPVFLGGGQENGLRSGTENVPGVIGFATAFAEAKKHLSSSRKTYEKLTKILETELKQSKIEPKFLKHKKSSLANFCPVCFPGLDAERLIYKLEEQGVLLSTGAACAASKGKKSHVLKAIGLSDAEIAGSLRISLGRLNTEDNVREAGRLIREAVDEECNRIGEGDE